MTSPHIPCPQCGAELRLPDRKLLGKTGKCPKCGHRFVLRDPAEGETAIAPIVAGDSGLPWEASPPESAVPAPPPAPSHPGAPEQAFDFGSLDRDPASARVAKIARRKRQQKLWRRIPLIGTGILAAGIVATAIYFGLSDRQTAESGPPRVQKTRKTSPARPRTADKDQEGKDNDQETAASSPQAPENRSPQPQSPPPTGQAKSASKPRTPIQLLLIPAGARIVVNLHPSALWKAGRRDREFIECLGPVATWLDETIRTHCYAEPAQIKELLVCVLPTAAGSPPQIATVVHLDVGEPEAKLAQKFGGNRVDNQTHIFYVNKSKAMVILDANSYAIVPAAALGESVEAMERAKPTDSGIEALLAHTDRSRDFTILFSPSDLKLEGWFPAATQLEKFARILINWFSHGAEIDAVAWSINLGNQFTPEKPPFSSEILLRPKSGYRAVEWQMGLRQRLIGSSERLLSSLRTMNVPDAGSRKIVSRVPEMCRAFEKSTKISVYEKQRYASLTTELPERAGPNLALGSILAWEAASKTNFATVAGKGPQQPLDATLPERLVDRFRTKIDVEFKQEALSTAFETIAAEARFKISVDGDALKSAGYSKNMPQDLKMTAPAGEVLQALLKKYAEPGKEMVIVIDEERKEVTVTTKGKAEAKGQKPHAFDS